MARYSKPIDVDRLNRSRGGSVFTRSGSNFTIRSRRIPRVKWSVKQARAYSKFAALSTQFRSLTSGNRTEWTNAAPSFTRVNSLGVPYTFNGLNMQIGSNANLTNANLAKLAEPLNDTPSATLAADTISISWVGNTMQISATGVVVPAGEVWQLFLSQPVTNIPALPSLTDCRLMYNATEGVNTLSQIMPLYDQVFPGISKPAGSIVYGTFRRLSTQNGQWSEPDWFASPPIT